MIEALLGEERCSFTSSVHSAAAAYLGKSGDCRAVEPLIKVLLGHEGATVREAAANALAKLDDARAIEPFIKVLADENKRVREIAAEMLVKSGDARAVGPLIKVLLGHKDRDAREIAAKAMGQLGNARAVEPFIKALRDENDRVRKIAAEAIGRLGDPLAVESLIQALGDRNGNVRQAAAEALGKLGGPRAVEPLIETLASGDGFVRRAAARALVDILTGPSSPAIGLSRWQHLHALITAPHSDHVLPHHCAGFGGTHNDSGIGVDFPPEPSAGMAEEPVPPPTQPVDQAVTVACPNCGKTLNAPKGSAGRTGRCPACNTRFPIPVQTDAGGNAKRDF